MGQTQPFEALSARIQKCEDNLALMAKIEEKVNDLWVDLWKDGFSMEVKLLRQEMTSLKDFKSSMIKIAYTIATASILGAFAMVINLILQHGKELAK